MDENMSVPVRIANFSESVGLELVPVQRFLCCSLT